MATNPFEQSQMNSLAMANQGTAIAGQNIQTQLMDRIARAQNKIAADGLIQQGQIANKQLDQEKDLAQLRVETEKQMMESQQQHQVGMQESGQQFQAGQQESGQMFAAEEAELSRQHVAEQNRMQSQSDLKSQELIANKEIQIANNRAKAHAAFLNGKSELDEKFQRDVKLNNQERVKLEKDLFNANFIHSAWGEGGAQYMKAQGRVFENVKMMMTQRNVQRSQLRQGISDSWTSGFTNLNEFTTAYLAGSNMRFKRGWEEFKGILMKGTTGMAGAVMDRPDIGDAHLRHMAGGQIIDGVVDMIQLTTLGLDGGERTQFKTEMKSHLGALLELGRLKREGGSEDEIAGAKRTAKEHLDKMRGLGAEDSHITMILNGIRVQAQLTVGEGSVSKKARAAIGAGAVGEGTDADPDSKKRLREVMGDIMGLSGLESELSDLYGGTGPNDSVLNQSDAAYDDDDVSEVKRWIPQVIAKARMSVSMDEFEGKVAQHVRSHPELWKAVQAEFAVLQELRRGAEGLGGLRGGGFSVEDLVAPSGVFRGRRDEAQRAKEENILAKSNIGDTNAALLRDLINAEQLANVVPTGLDLGEAYDIWDEEPNVETLVGSEEEEFLDYGGN